MVLLAINSFKNIGIIIVHDRMHSRLVHSKACDRRCPVMHSKGEKTPQCFGSRDIASFTWCANHRFRRKGTKQGTHVMLIMATIPPPLLYCNSFISKTYILTRVQANFHNSGNVIVSVVEKLFLHPSFHGHLIPSTGHPKVWVFYSGIFFSEVSFTCHVNPW